MIPNDRQLRSVLFQESPSTEGLGVTTPRIRFEERIEFFCRYYKLVSLADVRAATGGATLPRKPLPVTFDDAYASVARVAAPLLAASVAC